MISEILVKSNFVYFKIYNEKCEVIILTIQFILYKKAQSDYLFSLILYC